MAKTTAQRGYGQRHRKLREMWVPRVAAGKVSCVRCGRLIVPGERWDLGHMDGDRSQYAGPEHARCNRAAGAVSGNYQRRRRRERVVPTVRADDPERGVYWGPPDENGNQSRWSRAWYDWRHSD